MKLTKTIATICAIGMVVSTMAMPVQAKTSSKVETEIITMDDDTPTTTTKNKTKKTTKKATDEYKDWGKDLKVTVHNPTELTQAYLYANMMCAKSLTITFAKDYKVAWDSCKMEFSYQESIVQYGMLSNTCLRSGDVKWDETNRMVTVNNFGDCDLMPYFVYAYKTGNTDVIPEDYKELYNQLSKGVKSCTANANSITAVADNICVWLIDNSDRSSATNRQTFRGVIGKSTVKYASNGKMLLNCEGYAYLFRTMMRMAGYTAYIVRGDLLGLGGHAWNAIKVGDEYRYYDAGWDNLNMSYKEMIKEGYKPTAWYRDYEYGGGTDSTDTPTQKQVEALFIDWH